MNEEPLKNIKGSPVSYGQAHVLVNQANGLARNRKCIKCGKTAHHWSYDHLDPNELNHGIRRPYSLLLSHYRPICASCHKYEDLAYIDSLNEEI